MIKWFNDNQGFVLSILTSVYVVATLVIVYVMTRSNRIAALAIEHSQQLHHEQTRPYVVFDLVLRDRSVYADLQNFGSLPAFDVSVSLDPPPKSIGQDRVSPLLRNTIGMLAPGRIISDFIHVGHQFHETNPLKFSGTVAYRDSRGTLYEEPVSLDLSYYIETLSPNRKDVASEIEKLTTEAKNINRTLANLNAEGKQAT